MTQPKQCETKEQCEALYGALSSELKAPALALLQTILAKEAEKIRAIARHDPEAWWTGSHFYFGMWVRNQLRKAGFGEDYFLVANLDDLYVQLVEEALGIRE